MEELVADSIANGQQVIVFSNWSQITQVAVEKLQCKCKLGTITGNTPDADRQWIVDEFQDGNIDVLVATIGAAGTGLTLTAGTVVIFLDHPWSRALYEQAVDRAHRIGTNGTVNIITLCCAGTIDERIEEIVKKKGEMSDAIVDGKPGKLSKADIAYLLS
jgi:SNF2 family DNA or RNA helicase